MQNNMKKQIKSKKLMLLIVLFLIVFVPIISAVVIWSSDTYTKVTVTANNYACIILPERTGWLSPQGDFIQWNDNNYVCNNSNGVTMSGHAKTECCPSTFFCSRADGKCKSSIVTTCSQYTDAINCTQDSSGVGISDAEVVRGVGACRIHTDEPLWGDCRRVIECGCAWINGGCNSTYQNTACNASGYCRQTTEFYSEGVVNSANIRSFCNLGESDEEPPIGICDYSITTTDKCNETGTRLREWKIIDNSGNAQSQTTCVPGRKEFPCSTQLEFFGTIGAIILVILLIVFYLIVLRKNKNFKRKKKRR